MLRVTLLYGLYTFVTVLDTRRHIGTLSDSRHTTLALCTIRHQYRAGHTTTTQKKKKRKSHLINVLTKPTLLFLKFYPPHNLITLV